uniref:Uncharacterized protein n=1 Tax=Anguilla anguilla TaxID=7936 RepID=A0A0E9RR14_ANGAN
MSGSTPGPIGLLSGTTGATRFMSTREILHQSMWNCARNFCRR